MPRAYLTLIHHDEETGMYLVDVPEPSAYETHAVAAGQVGRRL